MFRIGNVIEDCINDRFRRPSCAVCNSHAENTKAGKSNKQNIAPNDGPFAVTKVYPDRIHFEIDRPSWMEQRQDPKFTIKAIRAIRMSHPDPAKQLERSATHEDPDDDDGHYEIEQILDRIYEAYQKIYLLHCLSQKSG